MRQAKESTMATEFENDSYNTRNVPNTPGCSQGGDPSTVHDAAAISIRQAAKSLSGDIPKHWYGGEAFASHFMDALSSTFPMGEAFFVRSVMYYRDRIDDPQLLEDIRGFAGQEGQHSRVHAEHLQLLVDHGYGLLENRNRFVDRIMRWFNRNQPEASIAVTAALEHLTAILARQLLTHPERFTDSMQPEMRALWRWHALEEAEHKSVAFDVMQYAAKSHRRRVIALVSNTLALSLEVFDRLVYMLYKDGLLFRREGWAGGWRFLFGEQGFLRGVGADYRAWYRRDFHPDQIDDRAMIEANIVGVLDEFVRT